MFSVYHLHGFIYSSSENLQPDNLSLEEPLDKGVWSLFEHFVFDSFVGFLIDVKILVFWSVLIFDLVLNVDSDLVYFLFWRNLLFDLAQVSKYFLNDLVG